MEFLLVHSPLVGPTTWRWVADALLAAGCDPAVPDLRSSALTGQPQAFIDGAVSSAPSNWSMPVVVGHSGAGFFLPSIAERLDAASAVFVDAGLPPDTSPATAGADVLDQLRVLAVDGILPRWSTWWGEDAMKTLVPDELRRAEVEGELPAIPIVFYETPIELSPDEQHGPSPQAGGSSSRLSGQRFGQSIAGPIAPASTSSAAPTLLAHTEQMRRSSLPTMCATRLWRPQNEHVMSVNGCSSTRRQYRVKNSRDCPTWSHAVALGRFASLVTTRCLRTPA
jgi:hypothetical protein